MITGYLLDVFMTVFMVGLWYVCIYVGYPGVTVGPEVFQWDLMGAGESDSDKSVQYQRPHHSCANWQRSSKHLDHIFQFLHDSFTCVWSGGADGLCHGGHGDEAHSVCGALIHSTGMCILLLLFIS